ncbi:MAG: MltA domain-containing protein [Betaproteobacteria bacterium]|nr:MltA domain-containing protein [Betaproteobacteria bacterium]
MPPALALPALRLRTAAHLGIALLACACATPPAPVAVKPPEALVCPPAEKLVCPPSPAAPAIPAPVPEVEYRGRLQPVSWMDIPDWGREPLGDSLLAFVRGCSALEMLPAWQPVCAAATALPPKSADRDIAAFFESRFDPYRVINADESASGMVTGYYEPLLRGSRTRTPRYRYPIYAVPQDLLVIDLSSVYPELKHKRLRGRIEGNRVVPYLARGEIDKDPAPLKGLEIAWVDDSVELFFLHIQGSGQVQLENGERLRVGYADQNGYPFRSVARLLIQRGELPAERTSMQGIKDWARRHPGKVQRFMNENPSFVFFRELPGDLPGPIGTLGVPLTAERSIAVDPRVIPLGVPVYLATTWPGSPRPLNRLMVAQDTGGAINGGVRADFYWGFGDAAGNQAGKMRQAARMWVLLPKGYTPPAIVQTEPKP